MNTRFVTPKPNPEHPAFQTGLGKSVRNTFHQHVTDWADCQRCHLHDHANIHVLTRGTLPCDILFIGEAPGASEDATGQPFVGRAGSLLDALIAEAPATLNYRVCITNIIACFPLDTELLPKRTPRRPRMLEAIKCRPRLTEIFLMAQPKAVVFLGESAQDFGPPAFPLTTPYMTLNLWHPSYLAIRGGAKSPLYLEWRNQYLHFLQEVQTHARRSSSKRSG